MISKHYIFKNRNGFSLIELLVVLLILTIIFAIAVSALGNYWADCQLEAASLLLQEDIRSLGQEALVKEYAGFRINLYVVGDKYRLFDANVSTYRKEVLLPTGVDMISSNFTNDMIFFSARGIPTSGGHVCLRSIRTGNYKYVIVTPVTGRIRISDRPPVQNQ